MKVLVVIGSCIQVNSSANLCHLAYIRGLVGIGAEVHLLSSCSKEYNVDENMKIPEEVIKHDVDAISLYEKLSLKKQSYSENTINNKNDKNDKVSFFLKTKMTLKKIMLLSYGVYGINKTFIKKSRVFKSDIEYDFLISISYPEASHFVAYKLLNKKRVNAKRWIQIWEDPWSADIFGAESSKRYFREEKRLLSYAEKICYVSPLTLRNQMSFFPDCAKKMFWQPLPAYYKTVSSKKNKMDRSLYGYFGDYMPISRDLKPFYEAAKSCNVSVNICGSPNNLFKATNRIKIYPRLTIDKLKPLEDKTNVLVFLSNRKGGQIPGKIYQYSATNNTILFILDGTDEEKKVLRNYFAKFKRYVFCENTVEDITRAINEIENGKIYDIIKRPLKDFAPQRIIEKILSYENG